MQIQHNIMAKNSYRRYRNNTSALSKNLEKLSSGYRINRAGDDAAGLAISEKMRAQITGLEAAAKNVKDGISLIQTAEGAMQEIHDMLQRLGYLAAEAANGTYDDPIDRQALQDEVDALVEEIERIKETTDFNGIPLLLGKDDTQGVTIMGGLPAWVNQPQLADGYMSGTHTTTKHYQDANGTTAYTVTHAAATVDFSNLDASNVRDLLKTNVGFCTTCCTCDDHYSIQFVSGTGSSLATSGDHFIYQIGIDGVTDGADLVRRIVDGTNGRPGGHYTMLEASGSTLIVYDGRALQGQSATYPSSVSGGNWLDWDSYFTSGYSNGTRPYPASGQGIYEQGVAYMPPAWVPLVLQIGDSADEADRLTIDLPNMSQKALGIAGLSVETATDALDAMARVRGAVNYVSSERGRMGAYQNRLEHTLQNLSVMRENVTDAESRIRDVDVAEEMMAYTKNNILVQSAQAMLAQANAVPQGVLQLLQ